MPDLNFHMNTQYHSPSEVNHYIIKNNFQVGPEFPFCLTWPADKNMTSIYRMASNFGE